MCAPLNLDDPHISSIKHAIMCGIRDRISSAWDSRSRSDSRFPSAGRFRKDQDAVWRLTMCDLSSIRRSASVRRHDARRRRRAALPRAIMHQSRPLRSPFDFEPFLVTETRHDALGLRLRRTRAGTRLAGTIQPYVAASHRSVGVVRARPGGARWRVAVCAACAHAAGRRRNSPFSRPIASSSSWIERVRLAPRLYFD